MGRTIRITCDSKFVVYANSAAVKLLGAEDNEIMGHSIQSVFVNQTLLPMAGVDIFGYINQTDYLLDFETDISRMDGKTIPVSISAFAQKEKEGLIIGYVMIIRDITEHKKTENALLISEEKYKTVLESVMTGYYEVDLEGNFTLVNSALSEITGYSATELIGKNYRDVTSPDTSKRLFGIFNRIYKTGEPENNIRFRLFKKTREIVVLEISATPMHSIEGEPTGFSGIMSDVTDKVKLEEMVIQTEKMNCIGGLAAGIAHEINNPLAGMVQTIQVIRNRLLADISKNREIAETCGFSLQELREYLELREVPKKIDVIMESGGRIADIVDNMLSFSRKGNSMYAMHSLADLLDKTLSLVASEYELKKKYNFKDIKIHKEYDETLPKIPCEGSKLQQVFFNLFKNGAQAMADNKRLGKERCFYLRTLNEGDRARIEIEDTGPGISSEEKQWIFEPFYTTKNEGEGTGLGLSISYFIITENHHGEMMVESEIGKGARFIILLPLMSDSPSSP